jgi:hypothetical protein
MPNVNDLRQQNKKVSLWWNRLASFWSKKASQISIGLILLALVPLTYSIIHKVINHHKATNIVKQSDGLAVQGKYNDDVQKLIEAYNTEPKVNIKAGIAYKIGVDYYVLKNKTEGDKWMSISSSDYLQANNKQAADNATQAANNLGKNIDRSNINPKQPGSNNTGPDNAL